MCGPTSKTIGTKEINYKRYVITIEKELAYPKRLNKIFYEISADTKEVNKYGKELQKWHRDNNSKEKDKPINPRYSTGTYKDTSIHHFQVADKYLRRRIKIQEQINEVVKLIKKRIDETK